MVAQYIIHKKHIIEKLKQYGNGCEIYYPIKANSDRRVIRIIDPFVSGYEVDSIYHLHDLLHKYKVDPSRIIYSALVKSTEIVTQAMVWGVTKFVVDNITDLGNIISLAGGKVMTFLIRIDVAEFVSSEGLILKWGASMEEIATLKAMMHQSGHNFAGYSFYLPQEINSIENIVHIVNSIYHKLGFADCQMLDIGGGMTETVTMRVVSNISELCGNQRLRIIVEPGRHLLDPCIDLRVTVLAIRYKQGKKLVFINSGIYDGLLDVKIKGKHFTVVPEQRDTSGDEEECFICGNSADISDNLGEYMLPKDMKVGDTLLILNCGAYCSEMDTIFCKNKRANYVVDS